MLHALKKKNPHLSKNDVAAARVYIKEYWPKLVRYEPKDNGSLIGLPHKYIVPAYNEGESFHFNEQYYWDTYFTMQGLLSVEHKSLVVGMIDNLCALYKKLQVIPNASRSYLTSRSQPPLLTSMAWDAYKAFDLPLSWLDKVMLIALDEYKTVWTAKTKPNIRNVHMGLSRYYDINHIHDLAEAESGWDMTTRFNRRALDYLAVDLNALLYKYEQDFAKYFDMQKKLTESETWRTAAQTRKQAMNSLMWSGTRGYYMDYNFVRGRRSGISSLAGFVPLWAGLVDDNQAKQMLRALKNRFEQKGGLTTTDMPFAGKNPGNVPSQWAYPNGWAPLHWLVVTGLESYEFHEDAQRIAHKWLNTNLTWYNNHGVFLEKYNVAKPRKEPARGLYPMQTGFAWTNAIFERLCQQYVD